MYWKRTCLLLIAFSLVFLPGMQAQECNYFPADCPSDQQLPDSADRLSNPVLPQELSMEIRLHDHITDLMKSVAEKKDWQVYQFDESDGSGYLNADRSGPLAFNLRPPHDYEISFIFIVNKDSLHAWQKWQDDFMSNMQVEMNKMVSNNDYSAFNNMQAVKKSKTERFRNASMIRVKIQINPGNAIASSIAETLHRTAQLNVPHAVVALQMHNDKTDEKAIFDLDQFARCSDLAFLLFGDWELKPDGYQFYYPAYHANKKNIDLVTPKTVSCNKPRTIAMHVEGSVHYINQFLQTMDTEELNRIIAK